MPKTIVFTKLGNGKVKYENGSVLGYFEPNLFVFQHPTNPGYIMLTDNPDKEIVSGTVVKWKSVLTPESADREELMELLQRDFFNAVQEPGDVATETTAIAINGLIAGFSRDSWLVASDPHHDYIHAGKFFNVSKFITNLGNDANYNILIETGSKTLDVEMFCYMEGEAEFLIYEIVSATRGTVIANINKKRSSQIVAETVFSAQPTGITLGALLFESRQGSSSNIMSNSEDKTEWLFDIPNTKYLIRTINRSGQNSKTVSFKAQFHEI